VAGRLARNTGKSTTRRRIGLFGNLGSGNIGNDASMEAILSYLMVNHPEAVLDAMCAGPENVHERYGIPAIPLFWHQKYEHRVSGVPATALKVFGKGADILRTAVWVSRHDAVIVPGMGVLEASLPLRPWGFPYAMVLLSASGRALGTKVALVSVGAGVINQRLTRWLFNRAAKMAFYRSYRDAGSREAMRQRGLDTTHDPIYPDLAFALPAPPYDPGDPQTVCVGVMDYHGSNDDRRRADEIYAAYVTEMKHFVRWLVDNGRKVRLLIGDTNGSDDRVVTEILADLKVARPNLDPSWAMAEPVTSLADVMRAMQPAGTVVAIRFHNVIAALKLRKPTIAISYCPKHDALMADSGLASYYQRVATLDLGSLTRNFTELESHAAEIQQALAERNATKEQLLREQFTALWAAFFPDTAAAARDATRAEALGHLSNSEPQDKTIMKKSVVDKDARRRPEAASTLYKRDFWSEENLKYSRPHYRMEKASRLLKKLARDRDCILLDVGCGPATLSTLLPPNIHYYGIDIAIQNPAPNLVEVDLLEKPITFEGRQFDIIVAQGVFEYVGNHQAEKFAEIVQLLSDNGIFVVSYVNFDHRKMDIYWPYSNVRSFNDFRSSLAEHFRIQRIIPTSYNWGHREPSRKLVRALNMHINLNIPFISSVLAVEYFLICSAR